jgi:hypothetical protein
MTRARDVSRLVTTPPNIYATDSEASSGYLSLSSASSTYLTQANNRTAFKNLIINGAMQVAQRATSVSSVTSGGFLTVDRWNQGITTQGTWTVSVENDAPTGSGFRKSHKMLCTTADASPAAADNIQFFQPVEGQNLQQIKKGTAAAEQLTISFWVKSNVTGTYIVNLYDNDNARIISKSYTISASGTWEYKTITFPADTTGAFDNDNNLSLYVIWGLGAGSNMTSGTLATTWQSAVEANRYPGQTNLAAATNNYWQVTGIQLEVGDTATPFEFKPFDIELAQCQRYYVNMYSFGAVGSFYSSSQCKVSFSYPVIMRNAVSATIKSGPYTDMIEQTGVALRTPTTISLNYISEDGAVIHLEGMSGATTAHGAIFRWGGSLTTISFSAEL